MKAVIMFCLDVSNNVTVFVYLISCVVCVSHQLLSLSKTIKDYKGTISKNEQNPLN